MTTTEVRPDQGSEPAASLPSIEVENVSASYRVRIDNTDILTDVKRLLSRQKAFDRLIPALRDVTFAVPRGTVLGVIGRNGAGKSTLCRVLNGVLPPETGRVVIRGRLNLLAPGIGFSAALTGRENITLGGLASGFSPERLGELSDELIDRLLDDFGEIAVARFDARLKDLDPKRAQQLKRARARR